MASAYGIVHNYGEPQSLFDAELALQALSYKQQKFDANELKVKQALAQYGVQASQLARPQDREYMYDKVTSLIDNINGLRTADFSSSNVTEGIIGHIGQA